MGDYEWEAGKKNVRIDTVRIAHASAERACGRKVALDPVHTSREVALDQALRAREEARQRRLQELERFNGSPVLNCSRGGCQTGAGYLTGNPQFPMTGPNGITCIKTGTVLNCS